MWNRQRVSLTAGPTWDGAPALLRGSLGKESADESFRRFVAYAYDEKARFVINDRPESVRKETRAASSSGSSPSTNRTFINSRRWARYLVRDHGTPEIIEVTSCTLAPRSKPSVPAFL